MKNYFPVIKYRNILPAIEISWLRPEGIDISKIVIYRMLANSPGEQYQKIGEAEIPSERYWDKTAETGTTYLYAVAAVLSNGTEMPMEHAFLISRDEIEDE